jgi:multicomponent Na+:H+ antiporter subunit F
VSEVLTGTAVALLLTIVAGLAYLSRIEDPFSAMLVVLLFGTTGVALTLVLGYALRVPGSVDVALVLALLAAILGVTFVLRRVARTEGGAHPQ